MDAATAARIETSVTEHPLDVGGAAAAASQPACGAVALFVGTVRATPAAEGSEGKDVVALDYEAHPDLAPARLRDIAEQAAARFGLAAVIVHHRTGHCPLGEPTVVIACGAPHRGDALDACRFVIEEVKATVPIWKRELYSDGSAWVGTGS